jgi:hypothetical protein
LADDVMDKFKGLLHKLVATMLMRGDEQKIARIEFMR